MPPRRRRTQSHPEVGSYSYTSPAGVRSSLSAAAQVLSGRRIRRDPSKTYQKRLERWQNDAWDLYDETGELHYSSSWVANALSRVRLVAAKKSETGEPEVVDEGPAAE